VQLDAAPLASPHVLDLVDDVRPVDRSVVDALAGRVTAQQFCLPFGPQQDVGVIEVDVAHDIASCGLRASVIGRFVLPFDLHCVQAGA
jgi:hypothetical protein